VGLLLLSLGFAALGAFVSSVNSYLLIQAVAAFAGAASGPIAYTKIIGATFDRNRGVALGVTMTGIGISAAVVPPLLASVIATHGWRAGFFALAVVPLIGALATAALIPRSGGTAAPKKGQARGAAAANGVATRAAAVVTSTPDAVAASPSNAVVAAPDVIVQPADAVRSLWVRSPVFWTMAAAFATMSISFAGLLPHFVPLLTDGGLSPVAAAGIAGEIGLAVIASRLLTGFLMDRLFAPRIAIAICVIAASGFVILVVNGVSAAPVTALTL
jgi:predicted MFS family arabinose efflux permease